jgi:hypothetical protein
MREPKIQEGDGGTYVGVGGVPRAAAGSLDGIVLGLLSLSWMDVLEEGLFGRSSRPDWSRGCAEGSDESARDSDRGRFARQEGLQLAA